ncbi:MAG: 16S rRNA (adenine(1518)-N(6)/adenine(1519)-N(6))-dimethyltransferase RsmA [Patescibacteria group bacterium]
MTQDSIDLTDRQQLIQYLQRHRLYTKKGLGQNFLVDRIALEKIVGSAELKPEDCVVEVGPGLGTMTEELVARAKKVVAIELDRVLASLLADRLGDRAEIVNADILRINLAKTIGACSGYKVVANIPYYITSRILRFFLEASEKPSLIVLLTQKEVAEQITAKPGDMSLLSVSVQAYGDPEIVDLVGASSFFPVPKVNSAILRVRNIGWKIENLGEKEFFRSVRIGFSSRRKTLLNNLSAGYQFNKVKTLGILEKVGLTDKTRAQELSVQKWQELCSQLNSEL